MDQYGIPEIFELEAEDAVKDLYKDIKFVLKVPIVNFIFRALAHYPEFLAAAWKEVRPSMLTINMELAANKLRSSAIAARIPVVRFDADYTAQELQWIERITAVFQYVNPKLLLIASAWAESLGNRPIVPQKKSAGQIEPGIWKGMPDIHLIHIPDAPSYLQELLLHIAKEHHSYDVASDFRALACFPRFLHRSWHYLQSYIRTDEYIILKANVLKQSISLVRNEMPYPVTLSSKDLSEVYSPAQAAGIMALVSFFQNVLPGLIVEIEYISRMMGPFKSYMYSSCNALYHKQAAFYA